MRSTFTAEELAEAARADAEIEEDFVLTDDEARESNLRDISARMDRMCGKERNIAAYKKMKELQKDEYGECCGCKHWSYEDWYCTARNDVFLPNDGCNDCFEEG